jgi:hypothetical protein
MASLDSPRAKLDRAYEHLEALDHEIAAFFDAEPYETRDEFDLQTGDHVFRIVIREPPPLRLGAILGDFVQNTRAALDHLARQLVLLNGSTPGDVKFPVYNCGAEVTDDVKARALRGFRPDHWARIDAAQPYRAGDRCRRHALHILAWLSNADKHRVLHPMYGYVPPPPWDELFFEFQSAGGVYLPAKGRVFVTDGRRVVQDAEIVRFRLDPPQPDMKVHMHAKIPFDVAFGDRWLPATRLEPLHEWVRQLVEGFASDFP